MSLRVNTRNPALTAQRSRAAEAGKVEVSKDSRFSNDFHRWLHENGYGHHKFAQGNVPAFGGKSHAGEQVKNEPVIFIHGNSDSAAGWKKSIEHFSSQGYKPSEMYAMTWGDADMKKAAQQHHSQQNLEEVRAFIQAVKEYTGAQKVDVIGHSMGVTLARKAIQGGDAYDPYTRQSFNLGKPLTEKVDTFVGIAGANQGLKAALYTGNLTPTTNRVSGLHPQSALLKDINSVNRDEGQHIFSIWSRSDQVIGLGQAARTSPIPEQDGQKVYNTYGHMGTRDMSVDVQLAMVRNQLIPQAALRG
jgi:triacylglycerol lipase